MQSPGAQSTDTDSLQHELQSVSDDKDRVAITLQLPEQLATRNPFLALEYTSESLKLAARLKSDQIMRDLTQRLDDDL